MKKKPFIVSVAYMTLLLVLLYEVLWLPYIIKYHEYNAVEFFAGLAIDALVCLLIAVVDILIIKGVTALPKIDEWKWLRRIGLGIAIMIANFIAACPNLFYDYAFYNKVFKYSEFDWADELFDVYALSITASFVVMAMLFYASLKHMHVLKEAALKAREASLVNQLSPHFLFNTISAGVSLIGIDPIRAEDFFITMSKIYRRVLETAMKSRISLKEELESLSMYKALLNIRFGEVIDIKNQLGDKVNDYEIWSGTMLLVMEDIAKHNRFSKEAPMCISISLSDNALCIINDFRPITSEISSHGIGKKVLSDKYNALRVMGFSMEQHDDKFITVIPLKKIDYEDADN